MRTRTTWIFGVIVAVAAFHAYTKRADTGDTPAASIRGNGEQGTRNRELGTVPTPAPAPAPVPAPVPDPDDPAEAPGAAGAAARAHREAIERLMGGDEARGSVELFRVARARTNAPEREDAIRRLGEMERATGERAARARAAGALGEERLHLTVAYFATLDPARRAPVRARLDEIAAELVFSPRHSEAAESYVVRSGDSLARIAARHDFPVEGIQLVNRLKGTSLKIGERLKIPKGPVEVVAVKSEFRLALLFAGLYVREYPIGTGRDGSTPEAAFKIETKIKEPTWHSREGVFPFGHPKNILGTRWLGFEDTAEHKGFGIHGTAFPDSVGREESSGCIRMRNEDVQELFGFVPKGASVTIVR